MVSSSGGVVSIGSGLQSQVGGVSLVKNSIKKAEELLTIGIPDAVIKYHKISKRNKYYVSEEIPEYYTEVISESMQKRNEELAKLVSRFIFVDVKPANDKKTYLKDSYMLDYIYSPIKNKGKGSEAIKKLVEKAVFDKKIDGRILVDVKTLDSGQSACGFFYKLGFRFVDKEKNEIMQNVITKKNISSIPNVVGLMYLPKESLHKLLIYKMMM